MKYRNRFRLHKMFNREIVRGGMQGLCNAVVIDNPWDFIDCTPDGNFTNFQYLAKGHDACLYAEVVNSVPFQSDGRSTVAPDLASHRESMSRILFSESDVDRLCGMSSGSVVYLDGFTKELCPIGECVDSWTW